MQAPAGPTPSVKKLTKSDAFVMTSANGQNFQSSRIRTKNRRSCLTALSLIWFLWDVKEPTPLFQKRRGRRPQNWCGQTFLGLVGDGEGLYGTTVCRCLVRRPHYSAWLMLSGPVVRASSPPKCLDQDCLGRRRTGTRHDNVYHSVREKQGIVVYRLHILQTVTSLRVVSLVF